MELVAFQVEEEFAFLESFVRLFKRLPDPAIPHDNGAGPVVALGNDAFEVAVLERVVLDFDGQALVRRVGGRSFGNGPGFEHPVHLQPQIPVQARRIVHMHNQQAALLGPGLGDEPARLGRAIERSFRTILRERVGG